MDGRLDRLLRTWRAGSPSPQLEQRLLQHFRHRSANAARPWPLRPLRVPLWLAAACILLIAVMLPLALRGLEKTRDAEPRTGPPAPGETPVLTAVWASRGDYVAVADLSRLRPVRNVNLRVVPAQEDSK